jgi:hypothetical protein
LKDLNFDNVFKKMDEAFSKMGEAFDTMGEAFNSVEVEDTLTANDITVKILKGKVMITGEIKGITLNGKKIEIDKK